MSNWRDRILNEFPPGATHLTLVADPDGLILEEKILESLQERGYEVVLFEDPVLFRYLYESRFRSLWDRGENVYLVVVLKEPPDRLNMLPYDLLQIGRRLSFSAADLFPRLSYPIVVALDRSYFDALFEAQKEHPPHRDLGETATKDFVLRYVFGITEDVTKGAPDLLRVLLRRHSLGQRMPDILDRHFIQMLRRSGRFDDWPLEQIVPNAQMFFEFLQERWLKFLQTHANKTGGDLQANAQPAFQKLKYPGPVHLPFDHPDVHVYIERLVAEGLLRPPLYGNTGIARTVKIHGTRDPSDDAISRLEKLLALAEEKLPSKEARYKDWMDFAFWWAKLVALQPDEPLRETLQKSLKVLQEQIDRLFLHWMTNRYADLHNYPSDPPVMVHHIPRYFAKCLANNPHTRIAFILLDGLSLSQWNVLRDALMEMDAAFVFHERVLFAWVPTITQISRQAAFAGKIPLHFPRSVHNTSKEPTLWRQFWVEQGLAENEVAYDNEVEKKGLQQISTLLARPELRVVGMVVNAVDEILHGMRLGAAGMRSQIRKWVRRGFLGNLLRMLNDYGFQSFLASDHGNVEAEGIGQPSEGVVAEMRGQRVRIYSDPGLRRSIKEQFPNTIEWPPIGLPEKFLPLIAQGRTAFVRKKELVVCHGGISIEEVLIPFIRVERRCEG